MTGTPLDAAELRLLAHILALVLDEQLGQSAAALEALRRRAAANRVTGGALKNLFDRIVADQAFEDSQSRRAELQRLQLDLDATVIQASRLAAENAALLRRLAAAERSWRHEMQRRHATPGPLTPGPLTPGALTAGLPAAALLPANRPPARAWPGSRHVAGMVAGMLLTLAALLLSQDQGEATPHALLQTAGSQAPAPRQPP